MSLKKLCLFFVENKVFYAAVVYFIAENSHCDCSDFVPDPHPPTLDPPSKKPPESLFMIWNIKHCQREDAVLYRCIPEPPTPLSFINVSLNNARPWWRVNRSRFNQASENHFKKVWWGKIGLKIPSNALMVYICESCCELIMASVDFLVFSLIELHAIRWGKI